jgi:hypothetical protein
VTMHLHCGVRLVRNARKRWNHEGHIQFHVGNRGRGHGGRLRVNCIRDSAKEVITKLCAAVTAVVRLGYKYAHGMIMMAFQLHLLVKHSPFNIVVPVRHADAIKHQYTPMPTLHCSSLDGPPALGRYVYVIVCPPSLRTTFSPIL